MQKLLEQNHNTVNITNEIPLLQRVMKQSPESCQTQEMQMCRMIICKIWNISIDKMTKNDCERRCKSLSSKNYKPSWKQRSYQVEWHAVAFFFSSYLTNLFAYFQVQGWYVSTGAFSFLHFPEKVSGLVQKLTLTPKLWPGLTANRQSGFPAKSRRIFFTVKVHHYCAPERASL